ncbi:hypothetical protein [Streptomyces sp. PSAA01]|uniref:hypothetical protein n=1 Tax=Streptomyces sp. PSAA01 TaxID=2912762 RepID=UPI001F376866|nr:hypothetical protein [Streptomyces sp. PSAA01]MCG0288028.1 hypothetical protein [Streptomyces sp. PSAA01]
MADEQPDELVILVHGTFAGDKERRDEGDRWWQRGSSAWCALTEALPKGTRLPDGQLFHWTGANKQSKRLSASMQLLIFLLKLERQGIRYHLVGHSHGGSVIWEALVSAQVMTSQRDIAAPIWGPLTERDRRRDEPWAVLRKRMLPELLTLVQLPGLRSVTTVGTPFLRFFPEPAFLRYQGWRSPRFSLADGGTLRRHRIVRSLMNWGVYTSLLGGGLGLSSFLAVTYHVFILWPYLGSFLLAGFFFAQAERIDLANSLTLRERAWRQVFARCSDRWLGLWAPTDEAIRVLQTAAYPKPPDYVWLCTPHTEREPKNYPKAKRDLKLPVRLNAKMSDVDGFVPATSAGRIFSLVFGAWRLAFNTLVGPPISRMVSGTLHESVQGNDVFNTALVYASPWPLPLADLPPGLPDDLAERLDRHADEQAARLGPEFRDVVAYAALADLSLAEFREWVKMSKLPVDRALLHTGYFGDPDVLGLIGLHIERHMAKPPRGGKARAAASPELTAWLDHNAVEVAARLADFRTRVPD